MQAFDSTRGPAQPRAEFGAGLARIGHRARSRRAHPWLAPVGRSAVYVIRSRQLATGYGDRGLLARRGLGVVPSLATSPAGDGERARGVPDPIDPEASEPRTPDWNRPRDSAEDYGLALTVSGPISGITVRLHMHCV